MRFLKNKWVILIIVIAVIAAGSAFLFGSKDKQQYYTAKVERGDISDVVEATGTINAVTTVQVGSQISGIVSQLNADFNSKVKKGQVIARIDPTIMEGNLLQAKADLENARANLAAAKANQEKSQAALVQAKQDYDRTSGLAKEGVMSDQQLDTAKATYDSAVAQVNSSKASVQQAQAQVMQREASVKVAQRNVDLTVITAPIDGTVINRSVDVGQTVAASFQAPVLFTIAQDLTKMQVYAKTDESDVGMIRPGQKVTFRVDAFPKDQFEGEVVQVRMNATTVQNVVTYDTVVEFNNPDLKLFPGMTAYVSIPVAQAKDVVKVPNGAMRYRPDDAQDLLAKYNMGPMNRGASAEGGQSNGAAQGQAKSQSANPTAQNGARNGGQNPQISTRRQFSGQGGDEPVPDKMPSPREAKAENVTVWKLKPDNTLEPVRLKIGITDRTMTAVLGVLKGDLKEGDQLVIGSSAASRQTAGTPGAPRPGMRR